MQGAPQRRQDGAMPLEPLTPTRRRELTRTHLLDAAAEAFLERGFTGASLDEIARMAGFSKGAVYSNFKSKEDLFLALVEQRMEAMVTEFATASEQAQAGSDRISSFAAIYHRLQPNPREWRLWTEFLLYALRNPALHQRLIDQGRAVQAMVDNVVERDCDELQVLPPVSVRQLATIYVAMFTGLGQLAAIDPEAVPDELFGTAIAFIRDAMQALGGPSSRKRPRRRRMTQQGQP